MKKSILSTLLIIFSFSFSHSQEAISGFSKNTVQKTHRDSIKAQVDTLLKVVRKEYYKKNYDRTIEIGEDAISIASKINDYKTIFKISSLMGNAFLEIEDTVQAKKIFKETLLEAEKVKDSENILAARIDLGNFYALQNEFRPASQIYKQALPLAKKFNDTVPLFILSYNIAEMSLELENIPEADFYVRQMNEYVTNLKAETYHAGAALMLGKYYVLKKKPNQAIKALQKAITLAEKEQYIQGLMDGYKYLAKAETLKGDYTSAYFHSQKVDSLKNKQYQVDKINAVENATAKYKLNQYKQDLRAAELQNEFNEQMAKRETTILWVKIAGVILLIFLIFAYNSYHRRKKLLIDLTIKNKQYLEAKDKSEELSMAKSTLFSTISHELRTPMYGIIGISSILMEDESLNRHKENVKSLKFSADYLLALINNVLQLNQLDTHPDKSLEKVKFNIRELVNNAIKSSNFIRADHKNILKINIDPNVPECVVGDDVKLIQVLINILGNSLKFTKNGVITLEILKKSSTPENICLQFLLKDTGIGISKDRQKHLFNEFSQTSLGGEFQGAGLGLPIVKKLLDLHNSEISLKSDVGQGTEIQFDICYEIAPQLNDTSATTLLTECTDKTILVVDDNKINLLVTQKSLKKLGFNSKAAMSGPQAIDMVKSTQFDLILMDINMPDMDGFETTAEIRKFNVHIPIIALTAVEINEIKEKIKSSGMNDYIIKPYATEVLVEAFNRCFSYAQ